jgi:transposase
MYRPNLTVLTHALVTRLTSKANVRQSGVYGLWICSKRLEKGRFSWPSQGDENGKVRLSPEQLTMLIGRIEPKQTQRKDWYRKEIVEAGVEKPRDSRGLYCPGGV